MNYILNEHNDVRIDVNCTPCQGQFQRCESVPLDGYRFYYP